MLDISAAAIERVKARLGKRVNKVTFIVSDITDFEPTVQFDFWHDRAAFHFLTDAAKVARYVGIADGAIKTGGYLILGTFSEDGPQKCSGLEIKQYTERSMSERFEVAFERIKCVKEEHETPWSSVQRISFCSFQRRRALAAWA